MMIGLMALGMALVTPAPLGVDIGAALAASPSASPAGEAAPAATADLRQMIAAAQASQSAAPTGKWDYASYENGIALEPGIYDAGGLTIAGGSIRLVARIPGTVVIRIPEGQYFLTASGHITAITVDGISFVGGKGAFLLTNTGENVTLLHSFTRNLFYNYTECAICNNASDHPYLVARDNVFMGAAGSNTIGIGWGGDGPHLIEHNQFLRDAYHLALGPGLGGNIKVRDNDFISWGGTATLADIWIKPNNAPRSYGVNSGGGSLIEGNKFGNENLPPDSPRILIANENEASGSGRESRKPDLVLDAGYVSGFHFTHNNFGADSHTRAPVIRSVISEIRNWEWRGNSFGGGSYSAIVQFPASRAAKADYANLNSDFEFTEADVVAGGQPALAFSNASFATLRDWAHFGELLRNQGMVQGKQILPREWIAFMASPSPTNPGYGAQLWLNKPQIDGTREMFPERGPPGLFACVGHLGQYIVVWPEGHLTVVRLGKTPDAQRPALLAHLADIVNLFSGA